MPSRRGRGTVRQGTRRAAPRGQYPGPPPREPAKWLRVRAPRIERRGPWITRGKFYSSVASFSRASLLSNVKSSFPAARAWPEMR